MTEKEPIVDHFNYRIIRLTPRRRPDRKGDIVVVPMLSEFGCETLGALYCLPELLRTRWAGKYVIVLAWAGRDYLYRGLADEVWELAEEHQWLRRYCLAFHNASRNLLRFETEAGAVGTLPGTERPNWRASNVRPWYGVVSNVCVFPRLVACPACKGSIAQTESGQVCGRCGNRFDRVGLFNDLRDARARVRWPAPPSAEAFARVSQFLPSRAVGITARNRKTYGRNLSVDFYRRLICRLEDTGYRPVWLGEPTSIHPCPYPRIPDFSTSPLARDLENTLALVSRMAFTVQAYTASSRLAALSGTPFLIVESPEQVWGGLGQEGIRLNLLSRTNRRKLIACQYLDANARPNELLELVTAGVGEIEAGDYSDMIGMVGNRRQAVEMRRQSYERIGEFLRHGASV